MEAYLVDWLNLLVRWLHVIAGIAWIGASFYFVWLDNHLELPGEPGDDAKGVGGELWSVHGGGFYHAQKYRVAPAAIPETLHWFKWEAYTTWLSGMAMLALIYWYGAEVYLINPTVADLSVAQAVGISMAYIVGGWFVYDLLCKSPLASDTRVFAFVLMLLCSLLAWSVCQLFSGRGAYIQFGSVLGTIMVANVFFVIIPGQKKMVASAMRGEAPDPTPGIHAKQRSVHNTYFTLPVLFVMTSNHYAMTYGHEYNWVILIGISLVGALIRIYFVARHQGRASLLPVAVSVVLLLAIAAAIVPRPQARDGIAVNFEEVRAVVQARCTSCHAEAPAHPAFPAPPLGIMLDTDDRIIAEAARIYQQTVVTRVMPIGNLTAMTAAERQIIDKWYQGLQDP
ncbi:MAG: urate hydroxylase PuuD [Gammaproteobacteria bacterium]|nr:urate hydroxylase PuuD [Gammaproteobacteria bacterium]MBT8111751.1 urate hydroxylase PuuD [Gammaproteobacteria bacterium]NND47149.1 urate hydroxylase PuuD [Woeseiaceae bacterium]NNL46450.1 urate hydroxylase PuuD [Woeseiaceae bacterium]